jgi:hypothetical protein
VLVLVFAFPFANVLAGLVTVLVGHVEITLDIVLVIVLRIRKEYEAYQNYGEVPMRICKYFVRALHTVEDALDIYLDLFEKFEEDLVCY